MHIWLVCIGLVIGTLAIYGQVIEFEFVHWDDKAFVSENPRVAGGFTWDNFVWSLQIHGPGHWHPLAWWIHQFNCQLFGLEAGAHHLLSVFLHLAAASALLMAFWRLSGEFWPGALVAALFAFHPLSVESVAWVSHLRDPLSTLFWALVMWSYAAYARRGGLRSYLLVLLLFALGLMAKPMLVTLPCVLLLLDYWPLRRTTLGAQSLENGEARGDPVSADQPRRPGWLLLEKAPLFALSAVSIWLSYLCQQSTGSVASLDTYSLGARLANSAQAFVLHFYHVLWPMNLSPIYPFPESFHALLVIGAAVLMLGLTAAAVCFGRRRPHLLVGWLWFLGTLVPVIGLLKMGVATSMTDHHVYVPMLGIYVALAWALAGLVRRRPAMRRPVIAMAAVVLLGLLPLSRRQAGIWRDTGNLFEHALAVTSDNYIAHNQLGRLLLEQGKTEEAIGHYHQALRIDPAYAGAHYNLGLALQVQGKNVEGIEHYYQALRIDPDHPGANNNLGSTLLRQGNLAEAVEHYRRALRAKPDYALARYNLGECLQRQGNIAEAIEQYDEALRIDPEYVKAHSNLGVALQMQGKRVEAIEHFHRALQIDPEYAEAHNNLGNSLMGFGNYTEAIEHFSRALRIRPDHANTHRNLGDAFRVSGDIGEAAKHYARALDLKADFPPVLNKLAWIRATSADAVLRDGRAAVELAERNCELTGRRSPASLDTLAAAYAEAGRFEEAIETASQAVEAASAAGDEALAGKIRGRVVVYRQGEAYREPGK